MALLVVVMPPLALFSSLSVFPLSTATDRCQRPSLIDLDSKNSPYPIQSGPEWPSYVGFIVIIGLQVAGARWLLGAQPWGRAIAAGMILAAWLFCYVIFAADPTVEGGPRDGLLFP